MQDTSKDDTRASRWLLAMGAIGAVLLISSLALMFWPQSHASHAPAAPPPAGLAAAETPVISTLSIPTPDCGPPTLVLGTTTFQIQSVKAAADGSLSVPKDAPGIADWVEGTNNNYVFLLSRTSENLALQTGLKTGDLATVYWADCTVTSFIVSTIGASKLSDPALLDQSKAGMSVFVQTDPSTAGFVVKGALPEEATSALGTPKPDESGVLAEVTLLDTSTSTDGTTVKVGVSIKNDGATAFTFSSNDASLTPEGAAAVAMIGSEPLLPKEIKPGSTETFTLTFPHPSAQTATLKIFTLEYDIEGY